MVGDKLSIQFPILTEKHQSTSGDVRNTKSVKTEKHGFLEIFVESDYFRQTPLLEVYQGCNLTYIEARCQSRITEIADSGIRVRSVGQSPQMITMSLFY